ncbi:hypothetical protein MMC28_010096 [Mycoblastus sanguinarius]|nr:hypothetical protein [Mycoblastus sanguinarius]
MTDYSSYLGQLMTQCQNSLLPPPAHGSASASASIPPSAAYAFVPSQRQDPVHPVSNYAARPVGVNGTGSPISSIDPPIKIEASESVLQPFRPEKDASSIAPALVEERDGKGPEIICYGRHQGKNFKPTDEVLLLQICLKNKDLHKRGTVTRFWQLVRKEFEGQSNRKFANARSHIEHMVQRRRDERKEMEERGQIMSSQVHWEYRTLLDEWTCKIDESRNGAAESFRTSTRKASQVEQRGVCRRGKDNSWTRRRKDNSAGTNKDSVRRNGRGQARRKQDQGGSTGRKRTPTQACLDDVAHNLTAYKKTKPGSPEQSLSEIEDHANSITGGLSSANDSSEDDDELEYSMKSEEESTDESSSSSSSSDEYVDSEDESDDSDAASSDTHTSPREAIKQEPNQEARPTNTKSMLARCYQCLAEYFAAASHHVEHTEEADNTETSMLADVAIGSILVCLEEETGVRKRQEGAKQLIENTQRLLEERNRRVNGAPN